MGARDSVTVTELSENLPNSHGELAGLGAGVCSILGLETVPIAGVFWNCALIEPQRWRCLLLHATNSAMVLWSIRRGGGKRHAAHRGSRVFASCIASARHLRR
jgi:hypothetical protein